MNPWRGPAKRSPAAVDTRNNYPTDEDGDICLARIGGYGAEIGISNIFLFLRG